MAEFKRTVYPVAQLGWKRCHYTRRLEYGHRTECGQIVPRPTDRDLNPGRLHTCAKCNRALHQHRLELA